MALLLLLVIIAIILGPIGAVTHGLFYLLVVGIVVLVADLLFFGAGFPTRSCAPLIPVRPV